MYHWRGDGATKGLARHGKARGRLRNQDGAALLYVALVLPVLFGFMALAIDLGAAYHHKRRMQTAADAAALSGAFEKFRNNSAQIVPSALAEAARNGFTDANGGVAITVSNPPSKGPFSQPSERVTPSKFVEVTINDAYRTVFATILGRNTVSVAARAVAGGGANSQNCIYALNPSVPEAFHVHDSFLDIECGVIVNSSDPRALYVESHANVMAPVSVGGSYDIEGGSVVTPDPATGAIPVPDPLASLDPPPAGGGCDYTNYRLKGGQTDVISPGVYCGGIHVESASTLTVNPGVYILRGAQGRGSLAVESNSTITGSGVTFYLTFENPNWPYMGLWLHDSFVQLSAPTDGPMAGMLFFQDRNAPNGIAVGGDNDGTVPVTENFIESNEDKTHPLLLEGTLYFPTQHLRIHATPALVGALPSYTTMIADTYYIESKSNVTVQGDYSGLPGGSPIKRVTLVE